MFLNILRLIVVFTGPVLGYLKISQDAKGILIGTGIAIGVLVIELAIQRIPLDDLVAAFIGIILGLITARVVGFLVEWTENPRVLDIYNKYDLILKIVLGYIGMLFVLRKKNELYLLDKDIIAPLKKKEKPIVVVDTSTLIDGRIYDIVKSGFISGILVIPECVLKEIHLLSDSEDNLKRQRGRRALNILKKLQEEAIEDVEVKIYEKDYPEEKFVDDKLIKACLDLNAPLLTNDFNLNKIASLKGVKVLNINKLANALKPVVLPGEELEIFIIKEGKEENQGVGYLEDGTMVVVENGKRFIGNKKKTVVQSVLQTEAGKIVFTRIKN
ncbi:MAG: PIN domain nuclease [Caldiserica bacterium]|nr:MAG: PIN domain nuclease [Caldisericota bacterium]